MVQGSVVGVGRIGGEGGSVHHRCREIKLHVGIQILEVVLALFDLTERPKQAFDPPLASQQSVDGG